jgi:hypothetical protein
MKRGRGDIAVSALSRLAFPVGWDNPSQLRSCADHVFSQIDNVPDPATRAEIKIRVLSLRDVAGAWSADHAMMAAEALREVSRSDDPVGFASARITHAWLRLRHAEYREAIAEAEDALRIVLEHRCVDVIRAEWVLGWALFHAGEWGRMQSVVASAAAHANNNGNSRIEALFNTQLAWLHVECGEYDRARELCQSSLRDSEHLKHGVGVAMRQRDRSNVCGRASGAGRRIDACRHRAGLFPQENVSGGRSLEWPRSTRISSDSILLRPIAAPNGYCS